MREIKFRAWDGEKMIYQGADGCFNKVKHPKYPALQTIQLHGVMQVCEVMQFTGLLDKKGKEIYEGDFVRLTCPYGENTALSEIKFNNGGFTVEANGWFGMGESDITTVGWAIEEGVSIEVIGNLFESSDLLGK